MSSYELNMIPKKIKTVSTNHRKMKGLFPHPDSLKLFDELGKYESISMHAQLPVVWDRAVDYQVYDPYGNIWIDFTSTIFVANSGHANPKIKKRLQDCLDSSLLHCYNYTNSLRVEFLKKLISCTPSYLEKAYLISSGTEATECLIKLIRLYGAKNNKKPGIVSFEGSYHGRTLGACFISGDESSHAWSGYDDPNIFQVPFPFPWEITDSVCGKSLFYKHIDALKKKGIDPENDISGFILESYLGWSAAFIPKDYIQAAESFCKKNNILLAFDEIQSGFGRTGKLFAYEHYEVQPDLIACGKGISSSLPLSAVLGRQDILDLPEPGSMSSTHSANPLSCASGLANLEVLIDDELIKDSIEKGQYLHKRLLDIKKQSSGYIKDIMGKGLVAAIILNDPQTGKLAGEIASVICEKSMELGLLLVHTHRESIKLAPPLSIPLAALSEGIDVLQDVILQEIQNRK